MLSEKLVTPSTIGICCGRCIAFRRRLLHCCEKVYGHLVMAKEVVARVFAKRIHREQMDLDDAMHISKLWFHDNAVRLYGLA